MPPENKKNKRRNLISANAGGAVVSKVFVLLTFFFISVAANAQCAMCRAAIESEGNTATAEAVNDGIVYLMVIPYVLVGAIGIAIYRMRRR